MNRVSVILIWLTWLAGSCASIGRADPPSSTGTNWRLSFADEFSGTSVDTVKWATQYEWGPTHNHAAYMQADKVSLDDGAVSLVATRESAPAGKQFTSGVLSSHGAFRVTEGYIEARIKMPTTRGSWPAFWMLSSGWPPEIDIMEYPLFVGQTTNDTYAVNNFWPGTGPPSDFAWIDRNINLSADYHNYGLQLDSTGLRFFFDGQQVKFSSYKPEFQNMYLIFNYAVGGWPVDGNNPTPPSTADWPNGHVDQTQAEWIRVWERTPTSTTSTWTMNSAASASWDTAGNWAGGVPDFERQQVVLSTLSGRSAMELRWNNSRTVGDLVLSGDTVYTLGQAGGGVESLMFADDVDNFNQIVVTGAGGHVFNTRLDLRSSVTMQNQGTAPLVFNGDMVGQARQLTAGGRFIGGALTFLGPGAFVLNGDGTYQSDTLITQGAQVELNGELYTDANYLTSTDVTVDLEATLAIATPDLGLSGLPGEASRVLVNGGTLRFKASGNVFRGFTIGAEGTTLSVDAGMSVRFTGSQQIASAVGGDLMVQGDGTALLGKSLGGNGDVIKSGGGTLTLSTANTYAGETIVHGGLLSVLGTTGSGNTIIGVDGTITGTGNVSGSLVVDGIVAPGPSTGMLGVLGDFTQTSTGTLQIELRGSGSGLFDVLNVGGSANVDGSLQIVLQDGFVPTEGTLFPILNAAGVAGTLDLVGDASGFTLLSSSGGLALYFGALPAGDYDQSGTVEAADYDVWKAAYGTATAMGTGADGNGDGIVDAGDFTIWRDNLGATVFTEGAGGSSLSVPEPNSIFFAAVVLAIVGTLRSHEPR